MLKVNSTKEVSRFEPIVQSAFFVPAVLLALTLALFAGTFSEAGTIPSGAGADLTRYFVYCREFGATQMRLGHFPLWNPHICGGTPFAGNWQSALFYPPNWIYLFLPLCWAINLEIALHVFLTGYFTSLWAKRQGFHPLAQLLAGTMTMFGGAYYLHVFAGHLSLLDACAWIPLLLLSVEEIAKRPGAKWALIGAVALAMEILAGHPQSVFNSLVAAALYAPFLLAKSPRRGAAAAWMAAAFTGGLALSAVQLGAGFAAASEGVRQGAIPYPFAASFSFIPRNLKMLVVPGYYGDLIHVRYWGGWFLWEMSAFWSVTGLTLALYGALRGENRGRIAVWAALVLLLFLLSLGANTPLFHFLYAHLPGFDRFRGPARFLFEWGLFGAMLAAAGLDAALRNAKSALALVVVLASVSVFLLGFGVVLKSGSGEYGDPPLWTKILADEAAHHPAEAVYISPDVYKETRLFNDTREFAGAQCVLAGLVCGAIAALLFVMPKRRWAAHALTLLAVLELFRFAYFETPSAKLTDTRYLEVERTLAAQPGGYRVGQFFGNPNFAMVSNTYDIYGYEPAVMGRYAELMKLMQAQDPDDGEAEIAIHQDSPLFRLLRCRLLIAPGPDGRLLFSQPIDAAPQLVLSDRYEIQKGRAAVYAAMQTPDVIAGAKIIVETAPNPAPVAGTDRGTARVVAQTTDSLTIEAQTNRPMLLLITDAYSKYWKVTALPGSAETQYEILPADYALRAIPLGAGTHRFRLNYSPPGYFIGQWISLFSVGVLALLIFIVWKRETPTTPAPRKWGRGVR